jgi:hypothetical protein
MMAEAPRRTAERAAGDDRLQIGDITIHRLADIDRIPWPIEAMFSNDADGLIKGAHNLLPPGTFDPDGRRLSPISRNTNPPHSGSQVTVIATGG